MNSKLFASAALAALFAFGTSVSAGGLNPAVDCEANPSAEECDVVVVGATPSSAPGLGGLGGAAAIAAVAGAVAIAIALSDDDGSSTTSTPPSDAGGED